MYKQLNNNTSRFLAAIMLVLVFGFKAIAGDTGVIKGVVKSDKGETLPGVAIKVMSGQMFVTAVGTDIEGKYTVKNLNPGKYDMEFSFQGYKTYRETGVIVSPENVTYVNVTLAEGVIELGEAVVEGKFEEPIINPTFSTVKTINIEQIENMAVSPGDVKGMLQAVNSDLMVSENGDVYMRGSRAGSTAFLIDGNRFIGEGDVPGSAIGSVTVLTGGVPAEYGDFTGGLVIITTKDYMSGMREKRIKKYDFEQRLKEKEAEKAAEEAEKQKALEEKKAE